MKKVLVVLLSLCMVLGCFSFAAAGSFTDVAADDANTAAINVLSGLEVILGDKGTTNFRPADGLKRVEACVIIDKLLGYGDLAEVQTSTSFTDVPASYWGSGYVAVAANLGLIEGNGDGTFGPEDKLSYDHWLTILVRALGYSKDVLVGNWPQNFEVKAMQLGLATTKQVGSAPADRSNVAGMAYKALLSDKRATYDAKGSIVASGSGVGIGTAMNTLLNDVFGAVKDDDQVITYAQATGVLEGCAGMKGTTYTIPATATTDAEVVAFVPNAKVKAYTGTYASGKLTLADKSVYTLGLTNAVYFCNGSEATATDLKDKDVVTVYATVNTADKTGKTLSAVSVDKWKAEASFLIATDAQAKTYADAIAKEVAAQAKLGETAKTVTISGKTYKIADIENLKKDDVVTLYVYDNVVGKVAVSSETVTGTITGKTAAGKYVLDGTQYAAEVAPTINGKEATYRLTAAGALFGTVSEAVEASNYAVITTEAKVVTSGYASSSSTVYNVEMLTADGEKSVFVINKAYAEAATGLNSKNADPAFEAGDYVTYSLNSDGEINKIAKATLSTATNVKWNAKYALLDNKALSENVMVVYKYTASDVTSYAVKTTSVIPETGAKYIANAKNVVEFVLIESLYSEEAKTVAMFASATPAEAWDADLEKVVYNYSAIIDGEADTIISTSELSFATPTGLVVGGLYELTVSDGYYASATNLVPLANQNGIVAADATASLVSITGKGLFGLSDKLQVYVKTTKASKTTITAGTYEDIVKDAGVELYDLGTKGAADGAYDIAVVTVTVE